jgi:hypothetical protein
MRFRVGEMWANFCQVSSGRIGPDTNVVFRSSSAAVHLLVQMSREMWALDWSGNQPVAAGFYPIPWPMARVSVTNIAYVL